MVFLFWDASALSKRYTHETGYEVIDTLIDVLPDNLHGTTVWGYTETFSILLRRANGGLLSQPDFEASLTALQEEVVEGERFEFLPLDDVALLASTGLLRKHNLNATDAALLRALLDFAHDENEPTCVMVSADKRLLRAADAEGLQIINPETASVAAVTARLAAL